MNHSNLEYMGAFSFGDSKLMQQSSQEFPGPGTYDPKMSKSYTGWTQSKDARNSTFIKDGAGTAVGTYNPNQSSIFPRSTKYSMGGQTRNKVTRSLTRETNHTPNTLLTKHQAPYYSFGYVPEPLNNFKTPGPGHYSSENPRHKFNKTENFFTKGMRQLQKKEIPGVGDYDVRQNQTPGPSYKIGVYRNSVMKKGQLKSFQKGKSLGSRCHKSSILIPNDNPAPGTYDPSQVQSTKGIVNLKAERVSIIPEQSKHIPGPGAYENIGVEDISQRSTKGIGFTQSKRPLNINSDAPGPGRYQTPSSLRSVLGKMAQKIRKSYEDQTPGPSSYAPQALVAKTRRSLTMYSNRVDFSKSDTKHIGPGEYKSSQGIKPQFGTMSRSKRDSLCSKNPGPGQYQIPTTIGRIPKYFKNLNKKIQQNGQTKTILYSPQKTKQIRLKTTANTFNDKKFEEDK